MATDKKPDRYPSGQPVDVDPKTGKVSSRTVRELKPIPPKKES